MYEQSPIKRIMKNTELVFSHENDLKQAIISKKILIAERNAALKEKTGILKMADNRPQNESSHLELRGLSVTDHYRETVEKHRQLHGTIKDIKKEGFRI